MPTLSVLRPLRHHYFGDKANLFREILARKVRERSAWAVTAPDDAAESLAFWFDFLRRLADGLRPARQRQPAEARR